MMMVEAPVDEDYIEHELTLLGLNTDDVYQTLSNLIRYYTFIDTTIVTVQSLQELNEEMVPIQVSRYSIPQAVFDEHFSETLKNAFIVVEDEKLGIDYLDARLFEHLTQLVMPGQLIVYNGKLYKVNMVSPQVGCVLHRAADSYSQRFYYRQLRTYNLYGEPEVVKLRRFMDIEIAFERRSFSVASEGYLLLNDNNDLRTAKTVDLSDDPSIVNFRRNYKNKSTLRITLPETDADIRFTVSLLLNEIFKTLFPDSWQYIAVLTQGKEDVEGILKQYAYGLEGVIDQNAVYILEDSDMDLGLLEAIDDNIQRIFEILSDFLRWHFEKMREPAFKDPLPQEVQLPEEKEKEKFLKRLFGILGRLARRDDTQEPNQEVERKPEKSRKRRRGKREEDEHLSPPAGEALESHDGLTDPIDSEAAPSLETVGEADTAVLSEDFDPNSTEPSSQETEHAETAESDDVKQTPEDLNENVIPEDEQIVLQGDDDGFFAHDGIPDDLDLLMPITPTRYQRECFLKYGFDEIDSRLMLDKVKTYLSSHGWSENALTRAR